MSGSRSKIINNVEIHFEDFFRLKKFHSLKFALNFILVP